MIDPNQTDPQQDPSNPQATNQSPEPTQSNDASYVDAYNPPAADPAATSSMPSNDQASGDLSADAPGPKSVSQSLDDQNIFFLLGVEDGTEEEREAFLDELQKAIWEDFMENDVELLVTEEEMAELEKLQAAQGKTEEQIQEDIIVYLEKLVPDLEEIMLEKALELKEDMVRERIIGMREYYASDEASLSKIDEAEDLVDDDQWRAAAELLNSLAV